MLLDPSLPTKVLLEPKRRQILKLLKEKSRTTGQLCAEFDVSRFAVMKHLRILEESRLVHSERVGRQRWYALTPETAADLDQLLREAVGDDGSEGTAVPLRFALTLPVTPGVAFQAFTQEIDGWWGFRTKEQSKLICEPHIGGRLYEAFDNHGAGSLLGTITYLDPPQRIVLRGHFGLLEEACLSRITLKFGAVADSQTQLTCEQLFIGRLSRSGQEAFRHSWQELLLGQFNRYVAARPQFEPKI